MKLSVYTDASSAGPILTLGAVLVAAGREVTAAYTICEAPTRHSSGLGEYAATVMGMTLVGPESRHLVDLRIFGDCLAVRPVFQGHSGPASCQDATRAIRHLMPQYRSVRWEWVKGHNGDQFNERAHEIASKLRRELLRQKGTTGKHRPLVSELLCGVQG